MAGFPVVSKLKEVRDLVDRLGWTRMRAGTLKSNGHSSLAEMIVATEDDVVCLCLNTAIQRATLVNGITGILIYQRLNKLIKKDRRLVDPPKVTKSRLTVLVKHWNDHVAKGKKDVLALLDRAIKIEEAEDAAYEASRAV